MQLPKARIPLYARVPHRSFHKSRLGKLQQHVSTHLDHLAHASRATSWGNFGAMEGIAVTMEYLECLHHSLVFGRSGRQPMIFFQTDIDSMYLLPHGKYQRL